MKMIFGNASIVDNRMVMDKDGPLFFNGLSGNLENQDKDDEPKSREIEFLMRNF